MYPGHLKRVGLISVANSLEGRVADPGPDLSITGGSRIPIIVSPQP